MLLPLGPALGALQPSAWLWAVTTHLPWQRPLPGPYGVLLGPALLLAPILFLSPQALHNLGLALLSGLQALKPWHYALKRIGGQFGSSVLSYFLFLKTLLAFNTLLMLLLLAFIVGVQAAFPPTPLGSVPAFTGLELLTGGVRLVGVAGPPFLTTSPGTPPCPLLCLQGAAATPRAFHGDQEAAAWPCPFSLLRVSLAAPARALPLLPVPSPCPGCPPSA